MSQPFHLGGQEVAAGKRAVIKLPVAQLPDHTPLSLNVVVVHGGRPGPVVFVSGAVHGDEVIGVEVIRRVLSAGDLADPGAVSGTLIAIPIVNGIGFLNRSRYLPDRRDLNRCFPGSADGPLADRLAHLFLSEIVARSDVGIDLHSASNHRENLPQVRIDQVDGEPLRLAKAFGAPVIMEAPVRDGSLREAAKAVGKPVLLYESGEALRFDETAVRFGVSGVLAVMAAMGMIAAAPHPEGAAPVVSHSSHWLRAPEGGVFRALKALGDGVQEGAVLGVIADPLGSKERLVTARANGLIIGRALLPLVNRGDALFHVAEVASPGEAAARAARREQVVAAEPLYDEDEIV